MADYNSSLPVRTETDGDAVVALVGQDLATIAEVTADAAGNDALHVQDDDVLAALTDGSQKVVVTDGTDDLAVNADGSINVVVQDEGVTDGEVHEYGTTAAGVPGTENTVVDYTVTALKTFKVRSFQASCSGKFKAELQVGPAASEVTKATAFGSTASGFVEMTFPNAIEVAAGEKVLVKVTNNDKANADVYAYVNGIEV